MSGIQILTIITVWYILTYSHVGFVKCQKKYSRILTVDACSYMTWINRIEKYLFFIHFGLILIELFQLPGK